MFNKGRLGWGSLMFKKARLGRGRLGWGSLMFKKGRAGLGQSDIQERHGGGVG